MSVHESVREVLAETTRALQHWAVEQRDVADIEIDEGDGYWRLVAQPFAAHACPFELIVYDDGVHYDIEVNARSFQELRTRNLQLLPALARAIATGRVLTTRLLSARTGLLCAVETTIAPEGDGLGTWRRLQHVTAVAELLNSDNCERQARHYLPYRRSSNL